MAKLLSNNLIRRSLLDRWKELGVKHSGVSEDAISRGIKLKPSTLSRFLKGGPKAMLPDKTIMFLCNRWAIDFHLTIRPVPYVDKEVQEKMDTSYPVRV